MGLFDCFGTVNMPNCIWFEGDKRNAYASMLAGLLFFTGWWIIIDSATVNPNQIAAGYWMCGVAGTLSLIMVNSVSNAQVMTLVFLKNAVPSKHQWINKGFKVLRRELWEFGSSKPSGSTYLHDADHTAYGPMRGDAYEGGCMGTRGSRIWIFLGFVMGFAAVIASCSILFTVYINKDLKSPGVALFLQNALICIASIIFKFGRSEDVWG